MGVGDGSGVGTGAGTGGGTGAGKAVASEDEAEHCTFIAVLAISLISLAEDVGMSMAHRNLEHVLQFGDKAARKAVPLAYAMLRASDPDVALLDTVGRLTHDSDSEVAHNAILALGLMGAGTNHARIATMLRNLSGFYTKDGTERQRVHARTHAHASSHAFPPHSLPFPFLASSSLPFPFPFPFLCIC